MRMCRVQEKYHDGIIILIAAFVIWVLLIGCVVWSGFVRADAESRIAVAEQEQRRAEKTAWLLIEQLEQMEQRAPLPEGMSEPVDLGEYLCTAYCAEEYSHVCGGKGITASGTSPVLGITAAADWDVLPAGSVIYIEGVGIRVIEDTGSAVKGQSLDVLVETHAEAEAWRGYGVHRVWLLQKGGTDGD